MTSRSIRLTLPEPLARRVDDLRDRAYGSPVEDQLRAEIDRLHQTLRAFAFNQASTTPMRRLRSCVPRCGQSSCACSRLEHAAAQGFVLGVELGRKFTRITALSARRPANLSCTRQGGCVALTHD